MSSKFSIPDLEFLGNKKILEQYKIGFLCSRQIPSNIILKTYDWAIEQREKGNCIISGFHSKIEKDVFHYLLKGTQPIILILARGMKKRWEIEIAEALQKNRLLIISPFSEK
jgi:predicted Rossmann fold nucleotide-binding protein DprA/Smf involved in DNA uptake